MTKKDIIIDKIKRLIKNKLTPTYKLYRKYKIYRQNKNVKKYGLEALIKIKKVAEELNITYWLDFGTLLGAVREGKFIEHDLDLDIGMFLHEYTSKLQELLEKEGFKKTECFYIDKGKYGRKEAYNYKGVVVDIFFYTKKGKKIYCHGFRAKEGESLIEALQRNEGFLVREVTFPFNGFCEITFLGHDFTIPLNFDDYLKAYYGENYMTKNVNWNSSMAKNVKILQNKIGEWCGKR
jgi:phosphorylcholine metabolism protein LicD